MGASKVDVLFLAKNRRAFTEQSFTQLLLNTDWSLVGSLFVYDDGSEDGTDQYLADAIADAKRHVVSCGMIDLGLPEVHFLQTRFGSPVTITNDFLDRTSSPLISKVDSDTVVCPQWLRRCLEVMDESPKLKFLGIEAFHEIEPDTSVPRSWEPCRYTGGIGVFRRAPFTRSRPQASQTYFGFGDWQMRWKHQCGWIRPSLPVFLLDKIPFEPWRSLSLGYIEKGWQREWPLYEYDQHDLWDWRF